MKMRGFNKHIIFLIVIIAVVYWKWWLPGPRVANDFPIIPLIDLKSQFNIPSVWFLRGSVGLGGYSVFTLWSWPIDFIAGILANFGFTFNVLERLMLVIPTILVGVFSIWNLLTELKLSKNSRFIATFFYLSNTYVLLLIDGGQLSIALAFAWFPSSYLFFEKSTKNGIKSKILAGLSVWILGVLDLRFVYILAILLTVRFIFYDKKEWIKSAFVAATIFIALNAYWIVPFIKYPLSNIRFSDLTKVSDLNFTQLKHSLTLLQPHWHENIFGRILSFQKEFLLIPALAFLALILKRKNKQVWFWSIVAIISVFLTKGANPPFPGVYPWLFTHIPGFSLFRDSTKFFFLVALSYSVLIAYCVDEITKRFTKFKIVFPVFITLYLLFLIRPVYLGKMTGTFSSPRFEKEYSTLANKLEGDKNFGRIFWIPSRTPLGYASILHSSLEANRLETLRPFAISTVGKYESQNFIREGDYMGELFDIVGIRYLAYPYFDPKRDDMSKEKVDYYNTFLSQIEHLPWVSEKISEVPIPVFRIKENKDKFFLSNNTYFVVGSDRIYSDIKSLGARFASNAIVFAEESVGAVNQIEKISGGKIVLYDKNRTDLTLSFVDNDKFISPTENLSFSPDVSGWWKREASDLVWWRDFLQQKYRIDNQDFDYGQGWAVAEGERELDINSSLITNGNILFARVMQSSAGGNVEFWVDNVKIGEINTKLENPEKIKVKLTGSIDSPDKTFIYDKADFRWVRIGEISNNDNLIVKTKGNINVINSLAVISKDEEAKLNEKVKVLNSRIINWKDLDTPGKKNILLGEPEASISYETITPTHYKIRIEGLKKPATLFFSETFDSGWELNSERGYKLYSLINGFFVDRDGEYDLYFEPQRYVLLGLVVSISTLATLLGYFLYTFNSKQYETGDQKNSRIRF